MDLPDGRPLFALLRSDDNSEWTSSVMQTLASRIEGEDFYQKLDNMLLMIVTSISAQICSMISRAPISPSIQYLEPQPQ